MANKFNLKDYLHAHRQEVIDKYNELTQEKFFSGISLRDFMIKVMIYMQENNVRSESRAARILPIGMGHIYFDNSHIGGGDYIVKKYKNDQQRIALA